MIPKATRISLETLFHRSRQMARHLRNQGYCVGRKRVRRQIARMGLRAAYQRLRTTVAHPEHGQYKYLLWNFAIERLNHVWCPSLGTSPTFRCGLAFATLSRSWTVRRAGRCPGDCPSVLQPAFHAALAGREGESLQGRPGTLDRKRHNRTTLSVPEIRVRLAPRLRSRSAARAGIGKWITYDNTERPHSATRR